jgi:hypothetical protein
MKMRFSSGRRQAFTVMLFALVIVPLSAQQQNKQNTGTKPATSGEKAEVRTEKFKYKQEFGPQSAARRGDRMTTVTPPNQNSGGNPQGTSSSTIHQEFGPTVHGSRKQSTTAQNPAGSDSKSQSTSAQNTSTSAPK